MFTFNKNISIFGSTNNYLCFLIFWSMIYESFRTVFKNGGCDSARLVPRRYGKAAQLCSLPMWDWSFDKCQDNHPTILGSCNKLDSCRQLSGSSFIIHYLLRILPASRAMWAAAEYPRANVTVLTFLPDQREYSVSAIKDSHSLLNC